MLGEGEAFKIVLWKLAFKQSGSLVTPSIKPAKISPRVLFCG
jgi:hypothetical protein